MTLSDPAPRDRVLRRAVSFRNPFQGVSVPFLAALYRIAFKPKRGASKLFVAKPAKALFGLLMRIGVGGTGRFRIDLPDGPRTVGFNARNTQFGAIYQPHFQPVYEPEVSALLDLLLTGTGVFLDIGANWGWYSLLAATNPDFHGPIHAFEPMPATFADLDATVRQAGLEHRIACHRTALSDRAGSATMSVPGGIQSGLARLDRSGGITIALATLDSLDLPPPSVIKMDVEDHENEVLRGAAETISRGRPFIVFENWLNLTWPGTTLAPLRWMEDAGYGLYFAGWETGIPGCVVPVLPGGMPILTLVPFRLYQRFHLPASLNILAAPLERLHELRRLVEGDA